MNTAQKAVSEQHVVPARKDAVALNNQVITAMLGCAMAATDGLSQLGIDVVSVNVLGGRPVIEVAPSPATHRFTLTNSSGWQTHMGTCPVSRRQFIQAFVTYRECLVTWIKWGK